MKRVFILVTVLFFITPFISTAVLAQAQTDFSGTWTIDKDKSDKPRRPAREQLPDKATEGLGRRGAPAATPAGGADRELPDITETIEQTAEGIHIRSTEGSNRTYTFDGAPLTMRGPAGGEMTSVLKWKGQDLVIESEEPIETNIGKAKIEIKEVRKLSKDGQVMTVQTTVSTPNGNVATKRVFNKVG